MRTACEYAIRAARSGAVFEVCLRRLFFLTPSFRRRCHGSRAVFVWATYFQCIMWPARLLCRSFAPSTWYAFERSGSEERESPIPPMFCELLLQPTSARAKASAISRCFMFCGRRIGTPQNNAQYRAFRGSWIPHRGAGVLACEFGPRPAARPESTGRGHPANPQPRTAALLLERGPSCARTRNHRTFSFSSPPPLLQYTSLSAGG